MIERAHMTVRYRLLIEPSLGTGLGNTVFVGLDVADADALASLVFEGVPKRIEQVRESLKRAQLHHGMWFEPELKTNARELRSAMASSAMTIYAPELVAGAEILERSDKARGVS